MNNGIDFNIDRQTGVANLIFDLPNEKINKLSKPVLEELERAINVVDGNKGIRVLLILSNKKDIFIAGADINEIKSITTEEEARTKVAKGQEILNKLAKIKIPTIALIDGACLGGGLELALACKYRVAIINDKTQLGLPEVNLGIIPGFGGTQRLPALVGLEESLKIILSGKSIDTKKALKIGLIDEAFHEEFIEKRLSDFITEILNNQTNNKYLSARAKANRQRFIVETLMLNKYMIFYFAKKNLWEKTKGHYLAQFFALEVIKKTYRKTYGTRGFKTELDAFCELVTGEICKNLIDIFFTNESLKKEKFIDYQGEILPIKNIGLMGAGIMGGGIAWLFANNNIAVRIKDISDKAIALGFGQIYKIFNQLLKIRKITPSQMSMKIANISAGLDWTNFEKSNLVIEAVVENIEVKKNILKDCEKYISKNTIIASNTSSLSIEEMAKALEYPSRFVGMHFFNPVNKMPLVEIIYSPQTSNQTIASVVKLCRNLGKTPIVVKDVPGFLVNRILLTYLNESAYLLQDGFTIKKIDEEIVNFGMPMGPFELADVVGIDVGVKVAKSLEDGYGSRMKVAEILTEIYQNHKDLLGKKTNFGFYNYDKNSKISGSNIKIYDILAEISDKFEKPKSAFEENEIIERCILTMVNEASKCLEEEVVETARYLDMAMIMGTGFPPFRGGILKYADKIGIKNVVMKLKNYQKKYGIRFEVSNLLIIMAEQNKTFY